MNDQPLAMTDKGFDVWLDALEAVDGSRENAVRNYVAGLRRTVTALAERAARTAAALEDARTRGLKSRPSYGKRGTPSSTWPAKPPTSDR